MRRQVPHRNQVVLGKTVRLAYDVTVVLNHDNVALYRRNGIGQD
jgi:hypothetical protein